MLCLTDALHHSYNAHVTWLIWNLISNVIRHKKS